MSDQKRHAEQAIKCLERVSGDDNSHVGDCMALHGAVQRATAGLQAAARAAMKQQDDSLRAAFTRLGLSMTYEEFVASRPPCPTKFGRENCARHWGHTEVECQEPGHPPPPGYPVFDLAVWAK